MAEAQVATEAPAAPAGGQDAGLDAEIARMEATLFPARESVQPQTPTPVVTPEPTTPTPSVEQPAGEQPAPEPGGDDDTDDEGSPEPQPVAGQPTSRMGRLRQQLTAAETEAKQAREALQQRQAFEQDALRQFVDLVLPDQEIESLRQRAENGDWEAKQRLDTARAWRKMAAPIADLAHQAVGQQMDATLDELRVKHGWERDALDKLKAAPAPQRLSLLVDLAKKASDGEHSERIKALEAEVQSLKTNRAANGSQPASGGVPRNGTALGLQGAVGRDGQLTDEALNWTPDQIRERFGLVAR